MSLFATGLPGRILLVGAGNMGGAMLERWVAAGIAPDAITVLDPGTPRLPADVRHVVALPEDYTPDTLVLAIKPQQLDAFVAATPGLAPRLLVSILAGVEETSLATRFPGVGVIVRAMPNLPVSIGKGVVALHGGAEDSEAVRAVETLMQPLGLVEWIGEEALFDAVTALSGCGPAFVFRFAEALAEAGVALGLPADQADRLARATLQGAGIMAAAARETPATLADRVASPGGSTREGLNVLDAGDVLKVLMRATLAASAKRNAEMAAAAR
jgi:pyrroline-5-carboxylate reductase